MNILVFSWRDPKHKLAGGAEQVMHEHMKGWVNAGHNVTLFSSKSPNLKSEELLDKIKIIRQGNQYIGVQIAAFFYYQKNKQNYDFIVDQFHGLPFFTPLYSTKPKIAVIQETAGNVWFLNSFPIPINLIIGLVGYLTEPLYFLAYRNTQFATGSHSAKIDVSKMGIPLKSIKVWPHGVIIPKLRFKKIKEKNPVVTFLGILSNDKGIFDAITCFKLLADKSKNLRFWIIGKPENNQISIKISNIIKKLNLEKRIKFWGFVSLEKKFQLLAKSHLLINPSKREGWGLVNIEANCMGTPVVSYKSAGLIDSVKNNYSGIFTKKNDPESLSKSIENLLANHLRYNKLSASSILWGKKFDWKNSTKISLKSIKQISKAS